MTAPNVHLEVRRMRHPANSFRDLDFLIPPGWKPGDALPSFLVFFDRIEESTREWVMMKQRILKHGEDEFWKSRVVGTKVLEQ